MKAYRKRHYEANKDKEKEVRDVWYAANKHKKQAYERQFRKEYYKKDSTFRIGLNVRVRLGNSLKKIHAYSKISSIVKDNLGCSIQELKKHLESKFQPGMTWNNYGIKGWHIDHIVPISSFNLSDPEQLRKACHYTNLQPLWAKDNLKKGNSYGKA
jgi:hypothetical protein